MPESSQQIPHSQTLVALLNEFAYETLEHENGRATVVRFRVHNPNLKPGDVLLVLSDSEVYFHGFVGRIDGDWAIATDRRGSLLPALVQ
jgi:hypothetical protein